MDKPKAKYGVAVMRAPMGGGWAWGLNNKGAQALFEFYQEPPAEIGPLGGQVAYIVEPQDTADLAEHLRGAGIAWKVEQ